MGIDIRTIIFIIGISHLMQVFVFFHQYKVNKNIMGPGWWLMWSAAESTGFLLILFRSVPSLLSLVIIFQDIILLSGTVFIYIGIMRFFEKSIHLKFILPFLFCFVILHLFFFIVKDDINIRTLIFDIFLAIIAFLTAVSIYINKTKSIASSANFIVAIFIIHGSIFTYRVVMIILGNHIGSTFSPIVLNYIQYFDALFVGLLWTFGIIMMINQRLNSEISESKTHFEEIFNTNPDAAVISRLSDGFFVDCNENYTKLSGYTKEDIAGKSSLDINIYKDPAERLDVVRMIQEKGFFENREILFQRKDGEVITGLMSAKLINLKEVPHIISVTRDISERKKMEAALRESETHYRLLTEDVSDVVWKQDKDNRFTYISPADERLRGYKADEWIGHHIFELLTDEGIAAVTEKMQQRLAAEQQGFHTDSFSFEVQQRCKDGTFVWTEIRSTAEHDIHGTITGYHGISRDITERKKAEHEITLKNNELQKLNSEKDLFFSVIAHDLKSPFNSILGFSELLVESASEKDLDGIDQYANMILQSSQRVMNLLTNLMDWSRSQTGRMNFNPVTFDLVSVINENALLFKNIAEQKNIAIKIDLPSKMLIYADNSMISTILRNLISNAIKFTIPGGEIFISAEKTLDEVTVSVSDTGIGISKVSIEKLFRIGENYSTSGTQNEQGTGLGLVLCKEFTEKHGGNIWAESELGKGSVFCFTLPVKVMHNTNQEIKTIQA